MPNAWNLPDGIGFKRYACAHCAETHRQLSALQVEIDRANERSNATVKILHEFSSRLESLQGWRTLADALDPAIPEAHQVTWRRLTDALAAATE